MLPTPAGSRTRREPFPGRGPPGEEPRRLAAGEFDGWGAGVVVEPSSPLSPVRSTCGVSHHCRICQIVGH